MKGSGLGSVEQTEHKRDFVLRLSLEEREMRQVGLVFCWRKALGIPRPTKGCYHWWFCVPKNLH